MTHPGAPELCDAADNDCDSVIDEGFDIGDDCGVADPPGCLPGDPGGCCGTQGLKVCTADHLGTICSTDKPLIKWALEGAAADPDPSCFDKADNDCDGLTDHQEPDCQTAEFCNGYDDDNNGTIDDGFVGLGNACTAGLGACQAAGVIICNAAQDAVVCSASAGTVAVEGPAGSPSCSDGLDNDCDGLTDTAGDPDCQGPELCDGKDNDGDAAVDEDFSLGAACSVGVGQCTRNGLTLCSADHQGTICDAVPGPATVEGPVGATCSDGIDNDCDGTADMGDASCNAGLLAATCALPSSSGPDACRGRYQIVFGASGAGPDAVITAELLALDPEGNVLGSTLVQNGDQALLESNYLRRPRVRSSGHYHRVKAPIPLLRVRVQDGANSAEAFCSPRPFLKVLDPGCCSFTSAIDGKSIVPVTVAIPGVDPHTLKVKVDGVDLLAGLGIDPATQFPGGPFPPGVVAIGGANVTVSDLQVRPDANALTMQLENLACGGHLIVIEGDPATAPTQLRKGCYVDDLREKCEKSIFELRIDTPGDQEVTPLPPTHVTGQVCNGRELISLRLNGLEQDTSTQTLLAGDGINTADTFILPIDTMLARTPEGTLTTAANRPIGTIDAGSNKLVADAIDEFGNRVFDNVIFAAGDVAKPGVGPLSLAALASLPEEQRDALQSAIAEALNTTTTEIKDAFVVGLTADAVRTVLTQKCQQAGADWGPKLKAKLLNKVIAHKDVDTACACDPPTDFTVVDVLVPDPTITCPVTFLDGKIHVVVNLPSTTLRINASGHCEHCIDLWLGEVCSDTATVSGALDVTAGSPTLAFDITEEQLERTADPIDPAFVLGGTVGGNASLHLDIGGIFGTICKGIADLINILSFDLIPSFSPSFVEVTIDDKEFNKEIGAKEVDPICLGNIEVEKEEVTQFGVELEGESDNVEITPAGLTATLKGRFTTTVEDTNVPDTPGAILTEAPPPFVPIAGAGQATMALADDTFNQLFASLVKSGVLKTAFEAETAKRCVATQVCSGGANAGASCATDSVCPGAVCRRKACTLLCDAASASPLASCSDAADCTGGSCVAGGECDAASANSGAACTTDGGCAGGTCVKACPGDTCNVEPLTPALFLPSLNTTSVQGRALACFLKRKSILPGTKLLMHGATTIPPRLVIDDDPSTDPVETTLHLNKFSFELLVDREGNGPDGPIGSAPPCLSQGQTLSNANLLKLILAGCPDTPSAFLQNQGVPIMTPITGDCSLTQLCVDLNFPTAMQFGTCRDSISGEEKPGIITMLRPIQPPMPEIGHVCGGGLSPDSSPSDEAQVTKGAVESGTMDVFKDTTTVSTPPLCADGLNLAGVGGLVNQKLIAIETGGEALYQGADYLGITGDIVPLEAKACNAASGAKFGKRCTTDADCPGGACAKDENECKKACNSASTNYLTPCETDAQCPGGACR